MWIKDGAVFTSHSDIRKAVKHASLPAVITDEVLSAFGFEPVEVQPAPAPDHTEKLEEAEPVKKDGKWVKEYRKRPATPEEIDAATKDKAADVRATRDALLRDTDWTQLADADKKAQGDFVSYRQALRDMPQQAGFPFNVDWPVKP
ncbi:MAG: hypothetical protein QG616_2289 [Pseudomonadota bacterium]|jgi:hypothetical protein|nr:hypothetical protein [Pseudomonadota bacterium]